MHCILCRYDVRQIVTNLLLKLKQRFPPTITNVHRYGMVQVRDFTSLSTGQAQTESGFHHQVWGHKKTARRYGMGQVHFRQERHDMACGHFKMACEIHPRSSVLRCYHAMAQHKTGQAMAALATLEVGVWVSGSRSPGSGLWIDVEASRQTRPLRVVPGRRVDVCR